VSKDEPNNYPLGDSASGVGRPMLTVATRRQQGDLLLFVLTR